MKTNLTQNSPQFKRWESMLSTSGMSIEQVEVLGEVTRDGKTLFSAFIDTILKTPEGELQSRCMLIKGESVMIIPWFRCIEGGDYTLMVEQRRPVNGQITLEFPGGMMDGSTENPKCIALKEVEEELGLSLNFKELVPLADEPFLVCTASLDERMYLYYFKREISLTELQALEGRITGALDEGERLQVRVVDFLEVGNTNSIATIAGLKLLERTIGKVF